MAAVAPAYCAESTAAVPRCVVRKEARCAATKEARCAATKEARCAATKEARCAATKEAALRGAPSESTAAVERFATVVEAARCAR
jgi:hypothetical protein